MRTRRDFLNSIGWSLAAGSLMVEGTPMPALGAAGAGIDAALLSATLTFSDGSTKTFAAAHGEDLGDFVVPFAGIVQRNIVVKDSSNLYSVYFRPDRNSDRVEVVVLYGDAFKGPVATSGSYVCEIFSAGRSLAKVEVPYHFWLARWRWVSSERRRVRKPADLVAAKLIAPYASTNLATKLPGQAPPYAVMGHSSVTTFMGQTGERNDIGINPEVTSAYMATESESCYQSMMAWAEAAGTGAWHVNDPKTNAIINWDKWPTASTYDVERSDPNVYVAMSDKDHKNEFIRAGDAHHPMLSYVPFLVTGDPYHAEEVQYTINFWLGGEHNKTGAKTYIFDILQTRGYAWMLRSAVFAYLTSDQIQSRMLLPKAYWKKVLDNNAQWLTQNFVNGTDAKTRVFSSGTSRTAMGFWQEDYLCAVLALMQRLGQFPEWRGVLDWKIKSNINRLNGTSGWPRTHPTIYYAQWWALRFAPASTNKGNGTIDKFYGERVNPNGNFGNWTIKFRDSENFDVIRPNGAAPGPGFVGTVGKKFASGYGPAFLIHPGSESFAAGDSITMSMEPLNTWSELAQESGVKESDDGGLQAVKSAYMQHLYAAMALAAPVVPEARPLFEWLSSKMEEAGGRVAWRDSFAAS